jgi:hypothetical protein
MHLFTSLQLAIPPTMVILRWIAAVVLFLELPVPFYWFILHPNSNYWRTPQKLGFALPCCRGRSPPFCSLYSAIRFLLPPPPRYWEMLAGMAAILVEFWLIVLAKRRWAPRGWWEEPRWTATARFPNPGNLRPHAPSAVRGNDRSGGRGWVAQREHRALDRFGDLDRAGAGRGLARGARVRAPLWRGRIWIIAEGPRDLCPTGFAPAPTDRNRNNAAGRSRVFHEPRRS